MTNTQNPSARTKLACELEQLPPYLFTPMTKEGYERNMDIYEKVLGMCLGNKKSPSERRGFNDCKD
ncbi:hypothetical protein SAMN06269250_1626 [Spirosoma fluviale]|uniref:Uncharacterized protein n=1 Tax=Spirosoma fluviale TaxID=1597977 RepID=A0A286FCM8_9BACT|nr:hypothetical protein SAMN06269250_1626 [Spirosoma fluviale]